eukprot:jgi/Ulvmu1/12630/UM093_0023.1
MVAAADWCCAVGGALWETARDEAAGCIGSAAEPRRGMGVGRSGDVAAVQVVARSGGQRAAEGSAQRRAARSGGQRAAEGSAQRRAARSGGQRAAEGSAQRRAARSGGQRAAEIEGWDSAQW